MADRLTPAEQVYWDAASALVRSANLAGHHVDETLRDHELTFARYEVLLLLSWSRRGRLALTRIAGQLMVDQAAVTGVVDRLVGDGLVRRVPHPTDGRVTLAQVTNRGRLRCAEASISIAQHLDLGIPPEHADEIFALVQKLRLAAGDVPDPLAGP
jgi:DNA-binding MarR family transcriptional regulator